MLWVVSVGRGLSFPEAVLEDAAAIHEGVDDVFVAPYRAVKDVVSDEVRRRQRLAAAVERLKDRLRLVGIVERDELSCRRPRMGSLVDRDDEPSLVLEDVAYLGKGRPSSFCLLP